MAYRDRDHSEVMMSSKRAYRTALRSTAESQRDQRVREKFQKERPTLAQLVATGKYSKPMLQENLLAMLEFAAKLKTQREKLRLSLTDLANRSGIDKAALSRLENGLADNPTVNTLERLARALGKRLRLALEDDSPVAAK